MSTDKLIEALQIEKEKAQRRYKTAVSNGMLKETFFNLGRATAYSKAIALAKGYAERKDDGTDK